MMRLIVRLRWPKYRSCLLANARSRRLVGVQGFVFDQWGQVLLARHTYRPQSPWGLPGGFLSHTETIESGLVREVVEEVGLSIHVGSVVGVAPVSGRAQIDCYLVAWLVGGHFRPSEEVDAIRFVPLDALPPGLVPEGVRTTAAREIQRLLLTSAYQH